MSFKKRMLIGLPIAFAFYFIILSLMWAANVEDSYFQKLPEALVTFGTLMLALAAFWSIKNSNDQEKSRRQDELAKEKRLRDERLLDEIRDWAINILTIINEYQEVNLNKLTDLRTRAFTTKATIPNITTTSKGFDRKFISLVDRACDELNGFTRLINELYMKNVVPSYNPPGISWTVTDRGYQRIETLPVSDKLQPIFTSLIEEAAKIKVTL